MTVTEGKVFEAHSKASDAIHMADKALTLINSHEKICAERYQSIKDDFTKLFKMMADTNSSIAAQTLKGATDEGKIFWKVLGVTSTALGVLYIILKATGRVI